MPFSCNSELSLWQNVRALQNQKRTTRGETTLPRFGKVHGENHLQRAALCPVRLHNALWHHRLPAMWARFNRLRSCTRCARFLNPEMDCAVVMRCLPMIKVLQFSTARRAARLRRHRHGVRGFWPYCQNGLYEDKKVNLAAARGALSDIYEDREIFLDRLYVVLALSPQNTLLFISMPTGPERASLVRAILIVVNGEFRVVRLLKKSPDSHRLL